jgi:branched-chain amino acid transport system substrate-binding protein
MPRPTAFSRWLPAAMALLLHFGVAAPARADLEIGVILSTTGPGASLGVPAENTVKLWPAEIAGQKVRLTLLNDNTDPTEASKAAHRLVTEQKVDIIVGPSLTPNSVAAVEVAGRAQTPIIALGGGGVIVEPQEGPRKWAFKMPAPEALSVNLVLDHMARNKVRNAAAVVVTTSYGEGFLKTFRNLAPSRNIDIVAVEQYNSADLSVTSQILKILLAKPEAVYIFSFGTPGALPQIELARRGYKGLVYQTHGVANSQYLKLGGKDIEGGYMAVAPVLVAEQLPDSHPTKKQGMEYVKRYEGQHGAGSRTLFGSTAWTALQWIEAAVPVALKKARPGTVEFRIALRDALEGMHEVVTPEGVFNMTPNNHNGIDERAQVLVRVEGNAWKLVK